MNESELYAALEEVWNTGGKPEFAYVNGELIDLMAEERQLSVEMFTPVGLKRLFPALKGT